MPATAKRQPRPTSHLKTVAARSTVTPVLAPEPGAHIPYFNPNETSQTHELVIDAVATMLSLDSDSRDVDMLLIAAMRHIRRRTFADLYDDEKELNIMVDKFVDRDFVDWKADIVGEWRKNRNLTPERSSALNTITAKIRENARRLLIGSFDVFMVQASPEEIRFLFEVLNNWDGRHRTAEWKDEEIYVAGAFEMELNRNTRYLRVPERMTKQVQQYIDALRAIEGKEAA